MSETDRRHNEAPRGIRRRKLVLGLGGTVAAGAIATAFGVNQREQPSTDAAASTARDDSARTRLVLLGTAGGPAILSAERYGISTAVVFEDRVYVVDLGLGSLQRLAQAGLGPAGVLASSQANLRGVLFTHLHSDHIADWPALYGTVSANTVGRTERAKIRVFGPGPRDTLVRVYPPGRATPPIVSPDAPSPGLIEVTARIRDAFAIDLNDRKRDSNLVDPGDLFELNEIDISQLWRVSPEGIPPRLDAPIKIWQDGDVRITATLVDHRPTAPAFAYRFDTPDGSIVVSGDTTVSANLIDLAAGADYLVHEVIDPAFVEKVTASSPPEQRASIREHLLNSHTTIEQVGRDVAEPAGVKNLVLTHLGPPTNSDHDWAGAQNGYSGNLIVGRDLLVLRV